ncbi:ABC transporter permease [Streptomyces sp. NPDC001714]|uniref:ABC transporter permease n=1 Tax=Streptomyces sp. NPDC001714 TaxID=3364603 RepID=UPI00367F7F44
MGRIRLVLRLAARDLRRRRAEAVLLLLAFTAAMTTLTLGLVLNNVTDQPYQQTRGATAGPDIIALSYPSAADASSGTVPGLAELATDPAVTATSGPFPATWTPLEAKGHKAGAQVVGRDTGTTRVDQPKITSGTWLGGTGSAVVERSFAESVGIAVGDTVRLNDRPFRVSGIAVTAAVPPYPQVCTSGCEQDTTRQQGEETGQIWVTQAAARSLATQAHPLYYFLNLRLAHADDADAFMAAHPPTSDRSGPFMNSWRNISDQDTKLVEVERRDLLIGSWLLGLLAVASVAVLVGGRMADQVRRVGLLKAVGATPGTVAGVLLAEYVALALVASGIGILLGWLAAPLLTDPGAGLIGTAGAPSITVGAVLTVVAVAVAVAVASTLRPAVRAARSSTVRALADSARPSKRVPLLIALSARLPVTMLLGIRLTARRPRRALLGIASVTITVSALVAVLTSRAHVRAEGAVGMDNPQFDRLSDVLLTLTVMLVALAAVNVIFITWATVLDARHASALSRALGATPRQVSAGLSAAQVLPALVGAVLGVPGGIGLFALVRHGGSMTYPSAVEVALTVVATVPVVAGLTAAPARLAARRPVAEALQSE